MSRGAPLKAFFAANTALCRKLEPHLPQKREDAAEIYHDAAARALGALNGPAVVVDAGGGRHTELVRHRPEHSDIRIVAVDISPDELGANVDADETRVADITERIPFDDASVDVIASQAVLEHLPNTEAFVAESARVLKADGVFLCLFSSKFSPHAVLNRLLPDHLSAGLVHSLVPDSEHRLGFAAYYDRTYPSRVVRMLESHGFSVSEVRISYYQSPYYAFFAPLFALSALYELAIRALGVVDLGAYAVVVARRVAPTTQP
jgi:SAM-dependent methyltransferase